MQMDVFVFYFSFTKIQKNTLICKFFTLISLVFNHLHLILGTFTITQIDAEPNIFAFYPHPSLNDVEMSCISGFQPVRDTVRDVRDASIDIMEY